jgi:hypothetical protein
MEVRNALGIVIVKRHEVKKPIKPRKKYDTTNRPKMVKSFIVRERNPTEPKTKMVTSRLEPELYDLLMEYCNENDGIATGAAIRIILKQTL